MSPDNVKLVREAAKVAGDELKGKLPEHSAHPFGRNSYAHVWKVIKSRMGKPYAECSDEEVPKVLEIIEYCRQNPF